MQVARAKKEEIAREGREANGSTRRIETRFGIESRGESTKFVKVGSRK